MGKWANGQMGKILTPKRHRKHSLKISQLLTLNPEL